MAFALAELAAALAAVHIVALVADNMDTAVVVVASAVVATVEAASVVGTGAEVLQIVATAEMTPRKYVAVAIVAVDIADMSLVVVALFNPPYNVTQYTFNLACTCSTTQPIIVSNGMGIMGGTAAARALTEL